MTKSIKITLAGIDVEVPIPKGLRGGTRDFMKGIRFAEKIEAPQDETAKNAEKALENLKPNTPPRVIIAYVNKAMPRHPAIKLAQKLESMGLAKAGVKQASAMIHGSNDKIFMQALSTNPFWAGVVAAGRALTKSDIDTEKFDREQWNRLSQKVIETIGYEGQDEPGAFKKKLAQRKAIRAIFGESIDRGQSMNVESINSILVKAIGQIQEQELSEVTQGFSKNEHDEPTKNELEKNIVATIYHFTKKGFPKVGFVDIHMEARPLFGEMFTRNYKGIVTKAINRLRRRGIVKIDEHAPQVVYMLTPEGIQAAKTGNMKKVKASASTKKQNEINKTILMKFFLEYIYDNQGKNGVGKYELENSVRESFSGEERSIMGSHREEAINELVKKEYIEQKWMSVSKWSAEYRWFITPKGSRARVQMKIPQF